MLRKVLNCIQKKVMEKFKAELSRKSGLEFYKLTFYKVTNQQVRFYLELEKKFSEEQAAELASGFDLSNTSGGNPPRVYWGIIAPDVKESLLQFVAKIFD